MKERVSISIVTLSERHEFVLSLPIKDIENFICNWATLEQTQKDEEKYDRLSPEAINWLANGDRGISSNTIFTVITGIDCMGGHMNYHPRDLADFIRCEKLLIAVPELRKTFNKMIEVSVIWERLVLNWQGIKNRLELDCPGLFEDSYLSSINTPTAAALFYECLNVR